MLQLMMERPNLQSLLLQPLYHLLLSQLALLINLSSEGHPSLLKLSHYCAIYLAVFERQLIH